MPKFIAVKRSADKMRTLLYLTEKMFLDGYGAEEIANALSSEVPTDIPITEAEVWRWISDNHFIRRPEPQRGVRLTPEPLPKVESGPWEPMYRSWMEDTNP